MQNTIVWKWRFRGKKTISKVGVKWPKCTIYTPYFFYARFNICCRRPSRRTEEAVSRINYAHRKERTQVKCLLFLLLSARVDREGDLLFLQTGNLKTGIWYIVAKLRVRLGCTVWRCWSFISNSVNARDPPGTYPAYFVDKYNDLDQILGTAL